MRIRILLDILIFGLVDPVLFFRIWILPVTTDEINFISNKIFTNKIESTNSSLKWWVYITEFYAYLPHIHFFYELGLEPNPIFSWAELVTGGKLRMLSPLVCCCCLPCNHCSNWTWVVEEILAFWYKAVFYALQGIQLFETMQTRLLH